MVFPSSDGAASVERAMNRIVISKKNLVFIVSSSLLAFLNANLICIQSKNHYEQQVKT
jgi:hypothetical protein